MPATATRKKNSTRRASARSAANAPAPVHENMLYLSLFAGALIALIPAVKYAQDVFGFMSPVRYIAAVATGFLTGVSGNPVFFLIPGGVAEMFGVHPDIISVFPYSMVSPVIPASTSILFVSVLCGITGLRDGLKRGRLRYEPAMILPVLSLTGMAAAWWAKSVSPLFNDLMSSVANSPYFLGAVFFMILFLGAAKLLAGNKSTNRHWLLSIAAGPVIGFWIGYLGGAWMWFLAAILLFVYVIVLNESIMGIIVSLPLVAAPVCAAKIFYNSGGSFHSLFRGELSAIEWPALVSIAVFFCLGHLFMIKVMGALPSGVRRGVFFSSYIIFMVYFIITL